MIINRSFVKLWWLCRNNPHHEWTSTADSRTGGSDKGCTFCVEENVSVKNSSRTSSPDQSRFWYPCKSVSFQQVQLAGLHK
jgi:hypothetical protein